MAKTKGTKLSKWYVKADGSESQHVSADADRLELRYADNAGTIEVRLGELSKEMLTCAAFHGLSQKLGDTKVGKDNTPADMFEEASAVWERIQSGDWIKAREGAGPRISDLVAAIVAVKTAAGLPVDEAAVREKCTDAEYRKKAGANPQVAAEVLEIRTKRQQAKLKEAKAAAKAAGDDALAAL